MARAPPWGSEDSFSISSATETLETRLRLVGSGLEPLLGPLGRVVGRLRSTQRPSPATRARDVARKLDGGWASQRVVLRCPGQWSSSKKSSRSVSRDQRLWVPCGLGAVGSCHAQHDSLDLVSLQDLKTHTAQSSQASHVQSNSFPQTMIMCGRVAPPLWMGRN